MSPSDDKDRKPPRFRPQAAVRDLMLLIAGVGLGLWLIVPSLRQEQGPRDDMGWFLGLSAFVLGGLSLVGPPLLIATRRRNRSVAFGPGRIMWFSQGMASWLMWPPIVANRVKNGQINQSVTATCYAYGTPLMAVYMTAALLAGGWFRKRRRRAMARSWQERFGLGLALVWACLGLYVLSIFYREEFKV